MQRLHHVLAVVQSRQAIADRKLVQLFVLLAQGVIGFVQLSQHPTQPAGHVVEHIGHRAQLIAAHPGKADVQVAPRDLGRARGQAVERPHDRHTQEVGGQADGDENRQDQ